jgi:acyl-coenzyme A thioesterase PaaI-like protein
VADDLLAGIRERAHANLFWRYLGIEVEAAGEGWVRLKVPMRDELRNAAGAPVHGGVLATLVDAAVGGALGTYGSAASTRPRSTSTSASSAPPAARPSSPRARSSGADERSRSARPA